MVKREKGELLFEDGPAPMRNECVGVGRTNVRGCGEVENREERIHV